MVQQKQTTGKRQQPCPRRRVGCLSSASKVQFNKLVGRPNEVTVKIESIYGRALLDSGSQISAVSKSFYNRYLSHLQLQPLSDLAVEGVTGQNVPYSGFIAANLQLPIKICENAVTIDVLLLVVADTSYNSRVPLLIGTNILQPCLNETVPHSLDDVSAPSQWWNTFKCMTAATHSDGVIGKLYNSNVVTIKAKSCKIINVHTSCINVAACNLLIEECSASSAIPGGLMVKPSVVDAQDFGKDLTVELMNVSQHDVIIPAKAPIADLHQVDLISNTVYACSTQLTSENGNEHLDYWTLHSGTLC